MKHSYGKSESVLTNGEIEQHCVVFVHLYNVVFVLVCWCVALTGELDVTIDAFWQCYQNMLFRVV